MSRSAACSALGGRVNGQCVPHCHSLLCLWHGDPRRLRRCLLRQPGAPSTKDEWGPSQPTAIMGKKRPLCFKPRRREGCLLLQQNVALLTDLERKMARSCAPSLSEDTPPFLTMGVTPGSKSQRGAGLSFTPVREALFLTESGLRLKFLYLAKVL